MGVILGFENLKLFSTFMGLGKLASSVLLDGSINLFNSSISKSVKSRYLPSGTSSEILIIRVILMQ